MYTVTEWDKQITSTYTTWSKLVNTSELCINGSSNSSPGPSTAKFCQLSGDRMLVPLILMPVQGRECHREWQHDAHAEQQLKHPVEIPNPKQWQLRSKQTQAYVVTCNKNQTNNNSWIVTSLRQAKTIELIAFKVAGLLHGGGKKDFTMG